MNITKKFSNIALRYQFLLAFVSFLGYGYISSILEKSYIESKFPVPYFIGQTSFSAEKIKMWYAQMIDFGTFDIYFKTQLIDFIFILSVIFMGFFIWTFIANLHNKNSFFRKYGYMFAFSLPIAGLFDVLENLISFFMIANPSGFADFIVYPYSLMASIKFGFWAIGLLWIFISILVLIISKIVNFLKK